MNLTELDGFSPTDKVHIATRMIEFFHERAEKRGRGCPTDLIYMLNCVRLFEGVLDLRKHAKISEHQDCVGGVSQAEVLRVFKGWRVKFHKAEGDGGTLFTAFLGRTNEDKELIADDIATVRGFGTREEIHRVSVDVCDYVKIVEHKMRFGTSVNANLLPNSTLNSLSIYFSPTGQSFPYAYHLRPHLSSLLIRTGGGQEKLSPVLIELPDQKTPPVLPSINIIKTTKKGVKVLGGAKKQMREVSSIVSILYHPSVRKAVKRSIGRT